MQKDHWFFKLQAMDIFLAQSTQVKQQILLRLAQNSTDHNSREHYTTVLCNLAQYEHMTLNKIYNFETDNPCDYLDASFVEELKLIANHAR